MYVCDLVVVFPPIFQKLNEKVFPYIFGTYPACPLKVSLLSTSWSSPALPSQLAEFHLETLARGAEMCIRLFGPEGGGGR